MRNEGAVMKRLVMVIALLFAAPAAAQNFRNADVREQPGGNLAATMKGLIAAAGPLWIAYAVPAAHPDWSACCRDHGRDGYACCGGCRLEERAGRQLSGTGGLPHTAALESGAQVVVLFRVEHGRLDRIRAFSDSCELDAGGLRVEWLTGVDAASSAALLANAVDQSDEDARKARFHGALMALAAHRDPSAVTALLRLARNHARSDVRGDALFWLAHRAGQQAAGAIRDAIEHDPDTRVKTRAVFALSQLPADEGVPRLIDVARTNRNAKVRQQAMFWLGQSKDARALAFFEEVLRD
jgi:hypothetical protein